MKKYIIILGTLLFSVIFLFGCGQDKTESAANNDAKDNGKVQIIATLFPQYDFARIVGGDKVEVTKLLPGGVESHSYEPTPSDIIEINESDMFLYTGDIMEPWAATIIEGIDSKSLSIVDVSQNVTLLSSEEDHEEDAEDAHEESKEHGGYDPHIWTDPTCAMIMVDNICTALKEKDPENADYYESNAKEYKEKLQGLDDEIKNIVANGERKEMIFGGRFAFLYFTQHYGLTYEAAIDSCSDSGEPSAKKIAELVDEINEEQIPVIYYEELSSTKVAESIASETGASLLLLHSCHNVTDEDLKNGVTYLSLMEENAKNLKKGLN